MKQLYREKAISTIGAIIVKTMCQITTISTLDDVSHSEIVLFCDDFLSRWRE